MGKQITNYLLYRWRYILGYSLISIAIIGLLLVAALYVPGGVSQNEMNSVVASSDLSIKQFEPSMVIHGPFHAFQKVIIELFGVSIFSIKLPSLILSALTIVGVFVLLRFWFRKNIAVLTTLLVITTGQFFFVAQSGSPGIMYIFWSVWILVAATMIARQRRFHIFWKIVLFGSAALSLYTPLSIYILLALASSTVLHPHLRYIIRKLSRIKLSVALLLALILLTPLIYAIVIKPELGLQLLGVPTVPIHLKDNALQIIKQYFDFISPTSSVLMSPVYGLGSVALIVLGLLRLFTTKYTARSYITIAWIVLLVPVVLINPMYTSVTFVPVLLLMGSGLEALLRSWYRIFPKNPYARVVGLIPLTVFIGGMVLSGVSRYLYGYHYDPRAASNFSQDIRLVNTEVKIAGKTPVILVVAEKEFSFYSVAARHTSSLTISKTVVQPTTDTTVITTNQAKTMLPVTGAARIVTDKSLVNADRLYVYKTVTK